MGLTFPFEEYLKQKLANDPKAIAAQSIGGLNVPALVAQGQLQKALLAYRNGGVAPNTTPDAIGQSNLGMANQSPLSLLSPNFAPPAPAQSSAPPPAQPDITQLSQLFGQAYPGQTNPFQTAMAEEFDPFKQSQIKLNNARTAKLTGAGATGASVTKYYDPTTGQYSPISKPGFQAVNIPATEDYRYFNESTARNEKNAFADAKNTLKDWRDIADQTNPFMSKGMGGSQTVFARAARANQAAARGLKTLNSKGLTWNELNGFVNSDLASIFAGGGAPHDLQLHQAEYNNVMNKIGNIKQFFTGEPSDGLVPQKTRAHIQTLIQEIIDTDNEIIDNQIEYVRSKYADRISQNPERFNRYVEKANKIKTVGTVNSAMAQPSAPSGLPSIGGTFNGQKVLSVTPL